MFLTWRLLATRITSMHGTLMCLLTDGCAIWETLSTPHNENVCGNIYLENQNNVMVHLTSKCFLKELIELHPYVELNPVQKHSLYWGAVRIVLVFFWYWFYFLDPKVRFSNCKLETTRKAQVRLTITFATTKFYRIISHIFFGSAQDSQRWFTR